MKIYTSHFGNLKRLRKAGITPISIVRRPPGFYVGSTVLPLALPDWLEAKAATGGSIDADFERFVSGLSAWSVLAEIKALSKGRDVALLSPEKNAAGSYRGKVAKWLSEKLIIEITEFGEQAVINKTTLF